MNFKKQDTKLIYDYITTHAPTDMTMIDIGSRTGKWLVPYVTYFPDAESYRKANLIIHFKKTKLGIWLTDSYMADKAKSIKELLDKKTG